MLGMSFDQLHRCDMSPLATGLVKINSCNPMLLSCPLWAPRRQECPGTATLPAANPRQRMAADAPRFTGSQLALVRSNQNPSSPVSVPFLLGKSSKNLCSAQPRAWAPGWAPQGEAAAPATKDLSLWRKSIPSNTTIPALRTESRAPPAGHGSQGGPHHCGSCDGDAACGHWTSSALTFPFPTLCISCCLGRGVNFCSNFTLEFAGRSAMGSWCAASKHPWRHAEKFGSILQPRHLARAHCSTAATRKLLAADKPLLHGRGMPRQHVSVPVAHTSVL